jgi:hypothetical protein
MNKTQLSVSLAALFLGASGMVFAADTTTTTTIKEPLTQSATSVEKNITRDSDSKGLNNATTHLETNQDKIEARKAARAEKRLDKAKRAEKLEKAEKVEKVERVEKAERPEKVERVEKAERPEKVERVEKVERPEKVK